MILFYAYKRNNELLVRQRWRTVSDAFADIAKAYDMLGECTANLFSCVLFDRLRDEFRDRLHAQNSATFPRFGPVGTSAVSILEHMLPLETHQIEVLPSCSNVTCMEKSESTSQGISHLPVLTLPSLCTPLRWSEPDASNDSTEASQINIQKWFDLWWKKHGDRYAHINVAMPLHSIAECAGHATILLRFPSIPPILFFELVPFNPVIPCKSITLSHFHGVARYILVGIIYLGGFHFSARMCLHGKVWNYDGHVNNGFPFLEPDVEDFDLCKLAHFEGREAHVLVYALDSCNPLTGLPSVSHT